MRRAATPLDDRVLLAMDLAGFKLVEASAGTGKTYTIANLYLRLVTAGYKVGELLVVTFTKAATEELRGRIRLRLHDALAALAGATLSDPFLAAWRATLGDDGEPVEQRLKLAISSMDEAAIYTIHGFCQRVLTEHAFNSGQSFDVEMISDDDDIWDGAVKDWWRAFAYPLDAAGAELLTAALGSVNRLIARQRGLRKPGVELRPRPDATTGELLAAWRDHRTTVWQQLVAEWQSDRETIAEALQSEHLKRQKNVYKLVNLDGVLAEVAAALEGDPPLSPPTALNALRASELQAHLRKGKEEPRFDRKFFRLLDDYITPLTGLRQRFMVAALAEAHEAAAEQVAAHKQAAGLLSFDDQLCCLRQALADNPALGKAIHARFPLAMIDEFQDTDAVQYAIFRAIYHGRDSGGLIMIGDPKQAIYAFRGGDIFAYIRAAEDAESRFTLTTNWRSTPGLIDAVNTLFSRRKEGAFIYREIPFTPVAAANRAHRMLVEDGVAVTPMTIWSIANDNPKKARPKKDASPLVVARTADEIARLLRAGKEGRAKLGEQAVRPADIAVLVRTHDEADAVKEALRRRGVAAVANSGAQVFASDEAEGLLALLEAVVDCRNQQALRRALASSLFSLPYAEMHRRIHDEQQWLAWGDHFRALNALWASRGFMAMFQQMQRLLQLGEQIARRPDGDRRLTNLLHLGELLQQASQSVVGMDALLHWFTAQRDQKSSEAELRLENDDDLVRIVTIHGSKGLEYPIVFLPFMWSCRPRDPKKVALLPLYDEAARRHVLHADPAPADTILAEKERLAEDVRLAYVALTRACAKLYLAWGDAGNAAKTALGWLLHHAQAPEDLNAALPAAITQATDVAQDLAALAACRNIAVAPLTAAEERAIGGSSDGVAELSPAPFTASIATDWRISSFSSMTRDVHQPVTGGARTVSDDPLFNLPAGSQMGLLLHALLEEIDFQRQDDAAARRFVRQHAARYGLNPDLAPTVAAWVADVLAVHLDGAGIALRQLSGGQRLRELAFDFSVARIDVGGLNRALEAAAGRPLQPLTMHDCRGLVTGIIDLVFAVDGRFYLADYKSNHLGYALANYAPAMLEQAMVDRRYDLQYLIYTLALHRYLGLRLPDYDYDTHFGGVYYLFLRGMRSAHGSRFGVYFTKPERALIERLDGELFGAEGRP